ncbi:MAG: alpha/beta hydrolase [Chloroflexota bacterium]
MGRARSTGSAVLRKPHRAVRRWLRGRPVDLAPPAAHSHTVVLPDGRLLGFDDIGDRDGEPLLYFHGFGSTRLIRHPDDAIAASLGIRLLAVDRPGIGLSVSRPGRRLLDFATDIGHLADTIGLDRFGIVAWSGGGPYALGCAWALPHRVTQVGLISTPAPLAGPEAAGYATRFHRVSSRAAEVAPWTVRLAMWRWSRQQRADPAQHLDDAIAGMVDADKEILADPLFRDVMLRNASELYRQGGRGLYDEALIMARPWGFPLDEVDTPVRIWHGELDQAVPVGMGKHLERTIPTAHATFLPGEAHHLLYDRWEEILGEVAQRSRTRRAARSR